ncbi:MAG TPA: DUF2254 family protein [Thermohalobaculum sp.]|nr:DUF2254 family protein [Thermohalobaculum sp.]
MYRHIRLLLRIVPSRILRLFEGFWVTPLALSLVGVALAIMVELLPGEVIGKFWINYFNAIDVDGTKSALAVIATSMVSLVTLVFSLTFVALSITAQQLSPRILDFVLRERSTQVLLGLALTTLLYASIVLSMGDVRGAWRLGMAMPPALLLAIVTLIMVVMFAHNMTQIMRADEMVARLGRQLLADIQTILMPPDGCIAVMGDREAFEDSFAEAPTIAAIEAGYVGSIDYEGLIEFAAKRDLQFALDVRESDFLLPGVPIARVVGLHPEADDPTAPIQRALNLTDRRESSDTASYEAAALCEAALRALSPGINDPATAIACLNRLFEGLSVLVAADPPPQLLAGSDGVARLLRPPRDAPEFLAYAVVPIIEAARRDTRTLERIRTLAHQLDRITMRPRSRAAIADLLRQVDKARSDSAA